MTTRCPFSDPQDPVSRVSNIRGQGPTALGFDRLGKHVLSSIARELEAVGLGYFPLAVLDPRCNTEPRKDQQLWVYMRDGGERARVLDAVLRPQSHNVRSALDGLVSGDYSSLTADEKLREVQKIVSA